MLFDTFLLAQNIKVTNWLTPVWIMSVGIAIGFVLVLLFLLKVSAFQRIAGFNSVAEKPGTRMVAGILTALLYLGLFLGFLYWRNDFQFPQSTSLVLPVLFAIPVCLILGFGVWKLVSRRMKGELGGFLTEGFLSWFNKICIAMVVFSVLGFILAIGDGFGVVKFVDDPSGMLKSLGRIPFTGKFSQEFTVEPSVENHQGDRIPVKFDGGELVVMLFVTNQRLEVSVEEITGSLAPNRLISLSANDGEPFALVQRIDGRGKIPHEQIECALCQEPGKLSCQPEIDVVP